MKNGTKSGEHTPPSGTPILRDAATHRLDGPDGLLTAEWDVRGMFWPGTSEDGAAQPAAASAESGQRPVITLPKPIRPASAPTAPVVIAPDLAATLPPRGERERADRRDTRARANRADPERSAPSELPSVERDAEPGEGSSLQRLATRHWPLATMGALLSAATIYSVSSRLVSSGPDSALDQRELPEFLRPPAPGNPQGPPSSAAPAPTEVPPELAAALEKESDGAVLTGDAGAGLGDSLPQKPLPAAPGGSAAAPTRMPGPPEVASKKASSPQSLAKVAAKPKSEAPPEQSPTSAERTAAKPSASAARPAPPASARAAPRPLTTYTYGDKALFAVTTAPMRVTDLVLEPGEKLVSRPTVGDAARWVISVVDSERRGTPQSHVFVKPLRAGLRTNLTLTTDRRSYFLELTSSHDGSYTAGVEWEYPVDAAERRREALAAAARERQSTTAVSDLGRLRFDYRIEATAGAPAWKPTQVFDDGEKTFIRFPRPVAPPRAPVLFVLRGAGSKSAQFVNYRVKGDLYVIERLVDAAELRVGPDESGPAEVVRISRRVTP